MSIDTNEQAMNTMRNFMNSSENKIRSIYNYGFKDGYAKGLKDASAEIVRKILEEKGGETDDEH